MHNCFNTSFCLLLLCGFIHAGIVGAFDGNAFADLAIGVPKDSVCGYLKAGLVNIFYSDSMGLNDGGNRFFDQTSIDMDDWSETGDEFGSAIISGDFNGDSFADLAIGIPYEDSDSLDDVGAVQVIFGTEQGLSASDIPDRHILYKYLPLDNPNAYDLFGYALSAGDYNGDGFDDLSIGVIGRMIGSDDYAGEVVVIYGSVKGLDKHTVQVWSQDADGIEGVASDQERFGKSLCSGDINGDGFDDLIVTAPADQIDEKKAGCVHLIYGSSTGLTSSRNQRIWQGMDENIPDTPETGDYFGGALSVGDYNHDGFDDLAIGVPSEDIADVWDAGVVHVLYGSAEGILTSGSAFFAFDRPGSYHRFGESLASGDVNGDRFTDLVIGIPFSDCPNAVDCGEIAIVYGSEEGLGTNLEFHHQGDGTIPGQSIDSDRFGMSLACADFDRDSYCDIAIGVPYKEIFSPTLIQDAGIVIVVHGSIVGLNANRVQIWHQNIDNVEGIAENGDLFGSSMAVSVQQKPAGDDVRVELWMPATTFSPGYLSRCKVTVHNPYTRAISDRPLFVILEIAGALFFAPAFNEFDNYSDDYPLFYPGLTEIPVLPAFTWPAGLGSFDGCIWYAALSNPAMTDIYGTMDIWEFGWSDH